MAKWESASAWNKMYACWLYILESFPYYLNFLFTILTFTFLLLSSIVLTFTFFLDLFHVHSSCLFLTLFSLSLSSCIFPLISNVFFNSFFNLRLVFEFWRENSRFRICYDVTICLLFGKSNTNSLCSFKKYKQGKWFIAL